MKYKSFKNEIQLSRLGMGTMRLPILEGDFGKIDYEKAGEIVDACMLGGVNYYDTAYIYHKGQAEEFLGRALARYPRDSYYVADKFNLMADPDYRRQFDTQLKRLGMDRIDFYLLHDVHVEPMLKSGCIEYFAGLKREGRIRYLGFSFHGSPEDLRRMLGEYPWDFVQIQLNYYDWLYGDAREHYEILSEAGIPVMVMEPAHGGLLAKLPPEVEALLAEGGGERSPASWAMRWVMEHESVQVVLSGMSELSQAQDNLKSFSEALPLIAADRLRIDKAAQLLRGQIAVACTGCRYCCPDCPMGLDIPELIKTYNDARLGGSWRLWKLMALPEEKRPTACIGCASCKNHCPQQFDIPSYMAYMRDELEKLTKG